MNKNALISTVLSALVFVIIVFGAIYVIPWKNIKWGSINTAQVNTITVTGNSTNETKNQIATFYATVNVVNEDKEAAITEANEQTAQVIDDVKAFGIPEEDIKTQNMSVYQVDEPYIEDGVTKYKPGSWRVTNSVEIILRDVDRASELAEVLNKGESTNVSGPNFRVDNTIEAETDLVESAMQDARAKAEEIAKSSNKQLGDVVSVVEGNSNSSPVPYPVAMMAEGIPFEPGTSTISKSLIVVFEMK